jgi:hypothetical protein
MQQIIFIFIDNITQQRYTTYFTRCRVILLIGTNVSEAFTYQVIQRYSPENRTFHAHHLENPKSHKYMSASYRGSPCSMPNHVSWDLLWIKWHWGRFSPSTSVSHTHSYCTNRLTFIKPPIIDPQSPNTESVIKDRLKNKTNS